VPLWILSELQVTRPGQIELQLKLTPFDVIGFDYHFNSLEGGDGDELSNAFSKVFEAGQDVTVFSIIKNFVPILQLIVGQPNHVILSYSHLSPASPMHAAERQKLTWPRKSVEMSSPTSDKLTHLPFIVCAESE
jgi:hypothetical protein